MEINGWVVNVVLYNTFYYWN